MDIRAIVAVVVTAVAVLGAALVLRAPDGDDAPVAPAGASPAQPVVVVTPAPDPPQHIDPGPLPDGIG